MHTKNVLVPFREVPSLTITAEASVLSRSFLYLDLARKVIDPLEALSNVSSLEIVKFGSPTTFASIYLAINSTE